MTQDQPNCSNCRNGEPPPFAFSHAFQPIVDIHTREVFAHEALVRGAAGESARSVLDRVTEDNRYHLGAALLGRRGEKVMERPAG